MHRDILKYLGKSSPRYKDIKNAIYVNLKHEVQLQVKPEKNDVAENVVLVFVDLAGPVCGLFWQVCVHQTSADQVTQKIAERSTGRRTEANLKNKQILTISFISLFCFCKTNLKQL